MDRLQLRSGYDCRVDCRIGEFLSDSGAVWEYHAVALVSESVVR